MLVLGRREGQTIKVGDDIVITIIRIGGEAMRIGIEAPEGIKILRGELEQHKTADVGGEG